jgi:class 3 adenylate cyclase
VFQSTPTEILKLKTFDAFVKEQPESGNFVILNITEEDVANMGGWPFPRRTLAQIQIDLINEGAAGIGWVVAYPQADRMGGDEVFAQTLGYIPSVLAMFEDGSGKYPKPTGTVIMGDKAQGIVSQGVVQNVDILANNTLQGLAIAPTDVDQLVRRIPLLVSTPNNEWIPSFGTQIYKALFDVKTYIIKTNDNGVEEISIRGIPPVKTDSLGRKWISWVDTPQTIIASFITGAIAFYLRFRQQFKLRLQIKKQFEHYLDPRQVKKLQDNPSLLKLGGERRVCTFLFTDVRGFTSLSEKLEPEEVTDIMNKALTVQVDCVQKNGGMVDKFIGDACMAIFNAPLDLDNHEELAVKTAIEMQKAIEELNKELPHEIAIGVGVNTGEAVIANVGSDTRFDYSAIGDAVNTAARLESATKEVGVDILIGENTAQSVNYKLKSLKPIKVKGKTKALKIFTV